MWNKFDLFRSSPTQLILGKLFCYDALQDWASMWVSQRWTIFFLSYWKIYWRNIWYVDKAKTHRLQNLKKINWVCNFIICVRMLLVQNTQFFLVDLSGFEFINFDPQQSEFPIVFNILVNLFWRAQGFGCMWVPFEFVCFHHFFF